MYGYITVHQSELKFREYDEYRAAYCGLCQSLHTRYGRIGQMTLSFDMTFLTLLLSALYEAEETKSAARCILHPLRKRNKVKTVFSDYAADMSILLAFYKMKDDKEDEKKISGALGTKVLGKKAEEVAHRYPRQRNCIQREMEELRRLELHGETNLDLTSGTFGRIVAEIFDYKTGVWSENLREMGFYLGKFIYIMDAYEDIYKDIKKRNYNPFAHRVTDAAWEEEVRGILEMMMASATRAFERLPILEHTGVLRNILYAGVWEKYEMIRRKRGESRA